MQLDISPPFVSCSPPPLKKICLLVVAKLDVSSFVLFPQASSGLIYYGLGRMLSYISPAVIAGANLSNCNFAMVLDKVGQSTPRDVFFLDAGAFSSQQGAHYCSPRIYVLQANNIPASERQKYIDNRKATAARDLESFFGRVCLALTARREEHRDEHRIRHSRCQSCRDGRCAGGSEAGLDNWRGTPQVGEGAAV